MTTSEQSGRQILLPWISSAEVSPARTFPVPASELASEVLAAACGLSSGESFRRFARCGSWSKMSPVERVRGLTRSLTDWQSSGMQSYRSRWLQRMSVLRTSGQECFLLLPTLSAAQYGSNQGGANGRTGLVRESLETMARTGKLLPTLCARDEKGIGPSHTRSGSDLCRVIGGHLSPTFCEWLMGFAVDWTLPVRASVRSAMRSSRSAPKSSATSSGS